MIILRQKEFVQAATLTVSPSEQTRNQTPRLLRKARASAYKAGKSAVRVLRAFSDEEEREYSYKSAKRLVNLQAGLKGLGNRIVTGVDNVGLQAGNKVKEIITGKPTPAHMKVKFRPKSSNQLKSEALQEVKTARYKAREVMADPEGTSGRLTKIVADKMTTTPLSSTGKIIVDSKFPGVPTTTPYLMVSPLEQKGWDYVNRVGVGNYTLGRITKPIKETVRNNANSFGRVVYRQATML